MKTSKLSFVHLLAAVMLTGAGLLFAADALPATYPLKKCVVSDEPLGTMGKAVKVTSKGTDVYLCCKSCIEDFEKEPAKYVKMVKDASQKKGK